MEVLGSNKLILEFIGRKGKHKPNLYTFPGLYDLTKDTWTTIENTKFHSSWDWLILPVRKCIYDIEMDEHSKFLQNLNNGLMGVDIDNTYEAVIEVIINYNKINKK